MKINILAQGIAKNLNLKNILSRWDLYQQSVYTSTGWTESWCQVAKTAPHSSKIARRSSHPGGIWGQASKDSCRIKTPDLQCLRASGRRSNWPSYLLHCRSQWHTYTGQSSLAENIEASKSLRSCIKSSLLFSSPEEGLSITFGSNCNNQITDYRIWIITFHFYFKNMINFNYEQY